MINRILALVVLATSLFVAGCAAGLHVGDERHGVGAGAAIGHPAP